jgi:hypothetical protein
LLAGVAAGEAALASPIDRGPRLGVEMGPFWLAVGNFIRPKLVLRVRGAPFAADVLLAPLFRIPQEQSDASTIFEVGGEIGYRQYLWRGLNLEASALLLRSQVDQDERRYVGFNVFVTATLGWRFDVSLGGASFYVLPQAGVGGDIVRTNPPDDAEPARPRLVGDLLLGFRF